MAELVDAPDSKSSDSNVVWVRFPLRPPQNPKQQSCFIFFALQKNGFYVNKIRILWKDSQAIHKRSVVTAPWDAETTRSVVRAAGLPRRPFFVLQYSYNKGVLWKIRYSNQKE